MTRMTAEEYHAAMLDAVSGLPKEFAAFVEGESSERGHGAGYEEIVSIAEELAEKLRNVIHDYEAAKP